jgi:flagellin
MVSLISDLGLIGLITLNARSGVVKGDLLRADSAINFVTEAAKSKTAGNLDIVEVSLGGVAGYQAAKMSIAAADTSVAAAVVAAEDIRDTVTELGTIAIQAKAANIDPATRDELIRRFETLRQRLEGQVDKATVGGVNFIAENAPDLKIKDAEGETIKIAAQDLSAQGLGISHISVTLTSEAVASEKMIKKALATLDTRIGELKASETEIDVALDAARRITQRHVESAVRDLIDPDITRQSAELRALYIRQRLGEHALAIANVNGFSFVGLIRPGVGVGGALASDGSASKVYPNPHGL